MVFLGSRVRQGINRAMTHETQRDAELVFVVEQAAEGGFVARAIGTSIFTQADSLEQLRDAVREAVACHFGEGLGPRSIRLRIMREEILRM
jgi:hypothetical protein